MVSQHFSARRLVEGAPSLIIEGKGNLCQIGDGRQRGPGPGNCSCFQLVVERHRHAQAAVHIQGAQVSVFFRGVGAAETAHDVAVGLNDIVIADVVCLGTATGATQTVQVTEQHARIDCRWPADCVLQSEGGYLGSLSPGLSRPSIHTPSCGNLSLLDCGRSHCQPGAAGVDIITRPRRAST